MALQRRATAIYFFPAGAATVFGVPIYRQLQADYTRIKPESGIG